MHTNFADAADFLLEMERRFQEDRYLCVAMSTQMPEVQGNCMRLIQHLDQELRWLKFITANKTNIAQSSAGAGNPILNQLHDNPTKNIMGVPVGDKRKAITKQALTPTDAAQRKYQSEVNDLYRSFGGLTDSDVGAILSQKGGEALLRGVAKTAGLADARTIDVADMSFGWFTRIREAISLKESGKALIDSLEAEVEEGEEIPLVDTLEEVPAPAKKKAAPAKKPGNPLIDGKNKALSLDEED